MTIWNDWKDLTLEAQVMLASCATETMIYDASLIGKTIAQREQDMQQLKTTNALQWEGLVRITKDDWGSVFVQRTERGQELYERREQWYYYPGVEAPQLARPDDANNLLGPFETERDAWIDYVSLLEKQVEEMSNFLKSEGYTPYWHKNQTGWVKS